MDAVNRKAATAITMRTEIRLKRKTSVELVSGFEPLTYALRVRCSTS
jgi:hypothetical protein